MMCTSNFLVRHWATFSVLKRSQACNDRSKSWIPCLPHWSHLQHLHAGAGYFHTAPNWHFLSNGFIPSQNFAVLHAQFGYLQQFSHWILSSSPIHRSVNRMYDSARCLHPFLLDTKVYATVIYCSFVNLAAQSLPLPVARRSPTPALVRFWTCRPHAPNISQTKVLFVFSRV